MQIKLYQNTTTGSWLITGCELNDPTGWTRFAPQQTSDQCDRVRFVAALASAGEGQLKLKPCKELQKFGTSTYEYDWECCEDAVLSHALAVADRLAVDLLLADAPVAA